MFTDQIKISSFGQELQSTVSDSTESTEPDKNTSASKEEKMQQLYNLVVASGMTCQSIEELVDDSDFENAEILCLQVEKNIEEGLVIAEQLNQKPIFQAIATQFGLLHKAIQNEDKEKAQKLGEALKQMGNLIPEEYLQLNKN